MSETAIRVFIVAQSDFQVDGLVNLIDQSVEHEVVTCARPGANCWEQILHSSPDLILVQYSALQSQLATSLRECRIKAGGIPIALFGETLPDEDQERLIRSGMNGYIANGTPTDRLLRALSSVAAGQIWAERRVLEGIVRNALEIEQMIEDTVRERIEELATNMTDRERQVFIKVLDGSSTKEIADSLHLSQQGVKLHLGRIFGKFEVANRTQLVLEAYRRVCPIANVMKLFRYAMKRKNGESDSATGPV